MSLANGSNRCSFIPSLIPGPLSRKLTVLIDLPYYTKTTSFKTALSQTGVWAANATGNYIKVVQRVPVKIILDDLPGNDLALGPGMSVVPKVRVK